LSNNFFQQYFYRLIKKKMLKSDLVKGKEK
jgi:hypothetical protein